MVSLTILGLSITLQFCAVVAAIRLIFVTRTMPAWLFIVCAAVLMGIRRSITLYNSVSGEQPVPIHLATEIVALLISLSLLIGILLIERTFRNLGQSKIEYQHLLDSMIDTYYQTDADGKIEVISESCRALLGYSSAEAIGTKMSFFYAEPDGRERFLKAIAVNGESVQGYQATMKHRNGSVVMVETNARYRRDPDGKVIGVEGMTRDITERLTTDHLNSQLGRIVENAINETYLFDAETFNFTIVNRSARDNLGRTMAELKAMNAWDLTPNFSKNKFKEMLEPLISSEVEVVNFESVIERKSGTSYPAEISIQYISSEIRPVFFAVIQDLTVRKRVEAELVQSQRMQSVGQLTGGVAHDFNNLLLALQLNFEQMSTAKGPIEAYQTSALKIIDRASQLTQRLLAYSRRQILQPEVININETLTELFELLQRTLGESIELKLELGQALNSCEIDEAQLENVILNLALNSRDAMPDGGILRITSQNTRLVPEDSERLGDLEPGDYIEIQVLDTGTGMTQGILKNAYEPFFTTKDVGEGTGLGLSMVYGFAKQSGGHVHIESTPKTGTTVHLFFRASTSKSKVVEKRETTETRTGNQTILLIEDEDVVRDITASTLTSLGYCVLAAVDGKDAIRHARTTSLTIDLILSDIMLPGGISGPQAVEQIIEMVGPTKTIFISGYSLEASREYAESINRHTFLQKPFTTHKLVERIHRVLNDDAMVQHEGPG